MRYVDEMYSRHGLERCASSSESVALYDTALHPPVKMRRPRSVDERVARTERREPAEVAVGGERFVNALADADRYGPGVVDQRAVHLPASS